MIRDLIARFKAWVKDAAAALRVKMEAAARVLKPLSATVAYAKAAIVVFAGDILNPGMRLKYRRTSSHAPIFSLFTFFCNC